MHCHALPCIAGDNVVQYDEFKELWTFLGQEEPVLQRTAAAFAAANEAARTDSLQQEFEKYDVNCDGMLSHKEVSRCLIAAGFKVTD
eukprot:COSAG05_NODE_2612_length_2837_cov_2.529584_1_plen_87_part_00